MQSTPSGESTRTDSAATEPSDATGCADQSEGLRQRKKRERGQALRQAALDLALEAAEGTPALWKVGRHAEQLRKLADAEGET